MSPFAFALIAIAAPLLAAPLCVLLGRRAAWGTMAGAGVALAAMLKLLPLASDGARVSMGRMTAEWVPELNVAFALNVDALAVFFGLLVSGMGLLIAFYAREYMHEEKDTGRFFAAFSLFMGSMMGLVLSDGLVQLAVFWEMTSVSSFLLIGFKHSRAESREGALRAFAITFGGGLCLLAGAALASSAGFTSLSMLTADPSALLESRVATPVLVLLLIAAFTKSAQFPFHVWLPGAMAAPTPVSAYLHSATMVKAGIYLVGRVHPIFGEHALWAPVLCGVGLGTMLLGAWLAISAHDLKAILAYSTVSQLGLIFAVYGFGWPQDALFHIAGHAVYKGALFMLAGIVDHETGTRDVRRLSGLWKSMPKTGTALLIAAASLASLPLTVGFAGKEMLLGELVREASARGWMAAAAVGLAGAAAMFFALRLSVGILFGAKTETERAPHDPPFGMWFPPALLAVGVVAIGVGAGVWAKALGTLMVGIGSVPHLLPHDAAGAMALGVSVAAAVVGFAAWKLGRVGIVKGAESLSATMPIGRAMDDAVRALPRFGGMITRLHYTGGMMPMLMVTIGVSVLAIGAVAVSALGISPLVAATGFRIPAAPMVIGGLMIGSAIVVPFLRSRVAMVATLSITGCGLSLFWMFFRAPDLALTQLLIECVSLFLLLAGFRLLPALSAQNDPPAPKPFLRGAVAIGMGLLVTYLTLAMGSEEALGTRIGYEQLRTTYLQAGGANAVNTIIVDYRGSDTFGEVSVMVLAALAVAGLLARRKESPDAQRA